eukprot:8913772-Prorocentrum_lima.AAC.1
MGPPSGQLGSPFVLPDGTTACRGTWWPPRSYTPVGNLRQHVPAAKRQRSSPPMMPGLQPRRQ